MKCNQCPESCLKPWYANKYDFLTKVVGQPEMGLFHSEIGGFCLPDRSRSWSHFHFLILVWGWGNIFHSSVIKSIQFIQRIFSSSIKFIFFKHFSLHSLQNIGTIIFTLFFFTKKKTTNFTSSELDVCVCVWKHWVFPRIFCVLFTKILNSETFSSLCLGFTRPRKKSQVRSFLPSKG